MKFSSLLLLTGPAAAVLAAAESVPSSITRITDPNSPLVTPMAVIPESDAPPPGQGQNQELVARQQAGVAAAGGAAPAAAPPAAAADSTDPNSPPAVTTVPDQWPAPSSGSIGLGTLTGQIGATQTLVARSEGTGSWAQAPWIGMAIGLTCTALAAVMLG